MRKILIFGIISMFFVNCGDDFINREFKDLTLDKVENYGDFRYIQLGDYILTDTNNYLAVRSLADPYHPGPITGITQINSIATSDFVFSSNKKQILMWDLSGTSPEALVLDVQDPLNIKLVLKFTRGSRTLIAWDDSVLYTIENDILKSYYFDNSTIGNTYTDISPFATSSLNLSGLYNSSHAFSKDRVLFAEAGTNIYTINFRDLKNPVVEGIIRVQASNGFIPYKNYLLFLGNSEVTFYDISNPLKPIGTKRISTSYNVVPFNVAVSIFGDYLYLGEADILKIYDISDINSIRMVKQLVTAPNDLESFYFFNTEILCRGIDDTWFTPYQNKVYFKNNIP